MKLNLGCGRQHKRDHINIDISPKCQPNYVWDVTNLPYPKEWAEEGSIEFIEADNLCEHIDAYKFIEVMNEWHRIMKPGGELYIKVPLCREDNMTATFTDPTHINFFTEGTFGYYIKSHQRHQIFGKDYGIKPWRERRQEINLPFLEVWLQK